MEKKIIDLNDQLCLWEEDWLEAIEIVTPDDDEEDETGPFIVIPPGELETEEGGDDVLSWW